MKARSSVVEHYPDAVVVASSILAVPTNETAPVYRGRFLFRTAPSSVVPFDPLEFFEKFLSVRRAGGESLVHRAQLIRKGLGASAAFLTPEQSHAEVSQGSQVLLAGQLGIGSVYHLLKLVFGLLRFIASEVHESAAVGDVKTGWVVGRESAGSHHRCFVQVGSRRRQAAALRGYNPQFVEDQRQGGDEGAVQVSTRLDAGFLEQCFCLRSLSSEGMKLRPADSKPCVDGPTHRTRRARQHTGLGQLLRSGIESALSEE